MSVETLNIPGRPEPMGYKHVSIATGSRLIHIAGQPGTDANGDTVPGGLAAQAEQALRNVLAGVAAAGATPADIVKVTIYVAGWSHDQYQALVTGLMAAGDGGPPPSAPVTVIGVQALFVPEHLVEIEAVAVAD